MLVLRRKAGEAIWLVGEHGERIKVCVEAIEGGRVKLGFQAPARVLVLREELMRRAEPAVKERESGNPVRTQEGEKEMATRAMIARKVGEEGFEGRYHHNWGTPDKLGKALYDVYHDAFQQDAEAMMHFLIDEHPAGWSNIVGADCSLAPGFIHTCRSPEDAIRPHCYCHGQRSEPPLLLASWGEASRRDCDYAYLIEEQRRLMTVFASDSEWHVIAEIALDGREPQWGDIG